MYEMSLDQTNTTRFLFGDDEPNLPRGQTPDEHFPTLVRRDDQMVSPIHIFPILSYCNVFGAAVIVCPIRVALHA